MDHLQQLPRDASGFRLRGVQVTRLETFVDAAFAFSLTLLVIVTSDLPQTAAELHAALRKVPTFVACFAVLTMFWAAHNRWSRRVGLEDATATVLSLALVLVVMVYVYPLRMVTSSFLSLLTGGWLPNELGFEPARAMRDLQTTFIVYSLGFGLLAWLLWRLNAHALRQADALGLDANERHQLRTEVGSHAILASVSLALAGLPMWCYATLGLWMPWYHLRRERQRQAVSPSLDATA
ncbi:TMEM175 family protein [Luteimonas sp. SDU101]|uniref:TMEM175 family protein n=1 Tax=Luteimonas sp. SDU101 TaxID=3422593 RepID=UPI003EB9A77F